MAEVTRTRRLEHLDLDYEALSGNYFTLGALLASARILWVIARTSGVLGTPPDPNLANVETLLANVLLVYTGLGLIALLAVLAGRMRREENVSSTRIIINYAGVVFFLLVASRVATVVEAEQVPIAVWGLQLTNGLVLGGVYALVALGYTLVYGILFMINFAHGEVLVLGTAGGWFALTYITSLGSGTFEDGAASITGFLMPLIVGITFLPLEGLATRLGKRRSAETGTSTTWILTLFSLPARFILGALIGYAVLQALGGFAPHIYIVLITVVALLFVVFSGMLTSMLVAIGLERVAYRPLRRAPRLTPLISAIGASFFLQQAMLNILGPQQRFYTRPRLIDGTIPLRLGDLGVIPITRTGIIIVLFSIVLMVLLYLFVQRSKMGRAMRSVAEDKDTAALMGVDIDQVIVFTFAIGAVLAGAAGVMMGFHNLSFNWRSGFIPGLKAFTAAVLGGIGNIPGAMFGGFFLGLVEALGPIALGIPTEYKDVIAFGLLVLVLIFRPTGIFGEVLSEKKV
ncbi:MAG: branched-chain amino acid ABC transporter permease [Chloroflexi bacterium]|nr:branched-chain amino acid ABC transporter permease [Chloroflexota bacterium]